MPQFAPQEIRTFFLTLVTVNRRRIFQVHDRANLMLALFQDDRAKSLYALHAFVIMPDHIHILITPAPDIPFEKAVQFIKGGFSFRLKSKMVSGKKATTNIASRTRTTTRNTYSTSTRTLLKSTCPQTIPSPAHGYLTWSIPHLPT